MIKDLLAPITLAGLGIGAYKAYDEYSNKPELEDKQEYIKKYVADRLGEDTDIATLLNTEGGASYLNSINAEAEKAYQNYLNENKTFVEKVFNKDTMPWWLTGGLGVLAAMEANKQQKKWEAQRPKYDPGQNPYMAQGGGIQAFAQGGKSLKDRMVENFYEKPGSWLMKAYFASEAPSDLQTLIDLFSFRQGGGIQGFAMGSPQFPRMTGDIKGPGDGQSDSIPAMLSNDEHVWTKQETETLGKMFGGDVNTGHQVQYALRDKIKQIGDKMGVSYT